MSDRLIALGAYAVALGTLAVSIVLDEPAILGAAVVVCIVVWAAVAR